MSHYQLIGSRTTNGFAKCNTIPCIFDQNDFFFFHRSSTRNTTRHGTALLGGTLGATLLMRPNISFTFTWVRWPFCCSSPAKGRLRFPNNPQLTIQYWQTSQKAIIIPWWGATAFFCAAFYFVVFDYINRGHVKEMKHLYLFLSCYIRHVSFLIKV